MIDVHSHLNFKAFANDFDQVIKQAEKDGVKTIINVGTSIETSLRAVELTNAYHNLYAIVGIHPHHADLPAGRQANSQEGWEEKLFKLAKSSKKVIAIGEIGLDYYSYKSNGIVDPKTQKEVFIKQIEIAHKLKLPLQIHNRLAGNDIIEIINNKLSLINNGGMFHCMSGDIPFLRQVLGLGFYVGFDGNITYEGIAKGETTPLPDLVRQTPIERIVTETDAPFLTPEPHRGGRNIPSHVIIVAEEIAKIKGLDFKEVEAATTRNAKDLFKLNPRR
ncbi:MAG: TatD family hydrolase [Candidatus Levybacteria bacterium]|nr:TatD family hydrolase [Candidatus Levybacteria bacterium]